jgi:hypothetical protein
LDACSKLLRRIGEAGMIDGDGNTNGTLGPGSRSEGMLEQCCAGFRE